MRACTGKFYNFENEDFLYEAPSYRHMLVRDQQPGDRVRFYQASASRRALPAIVLCAHDPRAQANFEHSDSDANMEIRNASNVAIYSYKCEGFWPACIDPTVCISPAAAHARCPQCFAPSRRARRYASQTRSAFIFVLSACALFSSEGVCGRPAARRCPTRTAASGSVTPTTWPSSPTAAT